MDALRLDVYPTDADAFEAAAALVVEQLRATAGGRVTVALAGGRGGRGVLVALAARGDLPWDRVEWFWGDERCVPPDDALSNVRMARDSLLVPRGIAAARIHAPQAMDAEPTRIAAGYAEALVAAVGGGDVPVFDLVLLGVGASGAVASLAPRSAALAATTSVAAVAATEVTDAPFVPRITLTPPVLRAARRVIVTATGEPKAAAVAAALRDDGDPGRLPARLVRPSARVTWIVDRPAATELLRDATPAD